MKKLIPGIFSEKKLRWKPDSPLSNDVSANKLTLLTYNVWDAAYCLPQRYGALLNIIRRCRPDIVGLQEVTPFLLEKILAQKWVRSAYRVSDFTGTTVQFKGVFMLSRFPLRALSLYELPSMKHRKALLAELEVNGQTLKVAVLHLESRKDQAPLRAKQLSMIFPLLEGAAHSILMGDFNFCASWMDENAAIDRSYQDLWSAVRKDEPGYTEDTDINVMRLLHKGEKRRVRFDRILVRSSCWRPESARLIGVKPVSAEHSAVFPSDHFGVTGAVRIVF
ncbi:MAG: endonuclease/exonuclease/phosphatase family protein [Gammaproteobacteria bacterium]|nr:endonuclease/exonuclease/phosphatase family protein [Gammaproteobacteria bacterium]